MIKDHRTVLRPFVVALPVQGRWVVNREKDFENLFKRHLIPVEGNLHNFRVASRSCTDGLIRRMFHLTACITRFNFLDAAQAAEDGIQTPETPSAERRDFLLGS